MKLVRTFLTLAMLTTSVVSVTAQTPTQLSKGRRSIAFTLPDGGGTTIGLWKFTTDRRNVGLNFGFDYTGSHVSDSLGPAHRWGVSVGPAVKTYFKPSEHVAPFHRLGLSFGYDHPGPDRHNITAGAQAGIGADWFPVDAISIGGYTGLRASVIWNHQGGSYRSTSWIVGTYLSALTMHVYF